MRNHAPIRDVIVIGGGPAGLAAGIHLSRAGYTTLLIERRRFGGHAAALDRVENYPGFPRGVSGRELMGLWLKQARKWGLATMIDEALALVRGADGIFSVRLKSGKKLLSRSVLWCAGAQFRKLGVPGENRLSGKGVWHTSDEAASCAGLEVAVIGGGEAAVQQAEILSHRAARVYLISRSRALKAHRLLLQKLSRSGIIRLPQFRVSRMFGARRLEAVELTPTGSRLTPERLKLDALFTLIGKEPVRPPASWRRDPPGFFECGDAAAGIFRQIAIAGGDGIRAAMRCIKYLEDPAL